MSIPLECPACHHAFSAPDSFVGKRGKCPKCHKIFTATPVEVPTFPELPAAEEPPPPPPVPQPEPEIATFPAISTSGKKKSPSVSDSGAIPVFPGTKKSSHAHISVPDAPASPSDSGAIPVFPAAKKSSPAVGVPADSAKPSDSGAIPVFPAEKSSKGKSAAKPSDSVTSLKAPAEGAKSVPAGVAVGGSSVQIGVATGPSGTAHGHVTTRPKEAAPPIALYAGIGGVALVAIVGGLIFFLNSGSKPEKPVAGKGGNPPATVPGETDPGTTPKPPPPVRPNPTPTPAPTPMARPADPMALESVRNYATAGIVRIEALRGSARETGLGILVDPRGYVATLYDVIQGATHVELVFHGDKRVAVEGHVGIDLPHGLILLKVAEIPEGARWVGPNDAELKAGDSVFPTALVDGKPVISDTTLSAVVPRNRLDFTAEKALSGDLRGTDDLVFLELMSPTPKEASGGPLLNHLGYVTGICISLGREAKKGYAIDIRHLRKLIDSATGEVRPLDPTKIAMADPDPTNPSLPTLPEKPVEPPMVNPEENQIDAAAKKLAALLVECRKQKFAATSAAEYAKLQDLAATITQLELDAESTLRTDEDRAKATKALEDALNDLADFVWSDPSATNVHAAEAINADPNKAFFFYGQVVGTGDGGIAMSLPGSDAIVGVAIKQNSEQIELRSQWIVIGRVLPNQRLGLENGKTAPVFSARHIIGKPPAE